MLEQIATSKIIKYLGISQNEDEKLMKEEYPPEFEAIYLNKKRQFSKDRITYNKEFLPTKIEWYYKGKEGLKW